MSEPRDAGRALPLPDFDSVFDDQWGPLDPFLDWGAWPFDEQQQSASEEQQFEQHVEQQVEQHA
jgi:hypothetical protein